MSCEVKPFGFIRDLKEVQKLLGFSQDESWLSSVYHSVSPTGEIIAFAHGSKLVILGTQWTDKKSSPEYIITWRGDLENPNDIITALLCIPLHGASITEGAEWTCIAVGLTSGMVSFYSDSGMQLFSQKWHDEPIHSVKAQYEHNSREEIHIHYLSCVCLIQGNQLFPVLKGLNQRLSKNVITSGSKTNVFQFPDTIPCKKWEYRSKTGVVNDSVIVGQSDLSSFDHLLDQTLEKGFYAKPRSAPVQQSLVLGAGVKPFVGFHYAKEGYVPADLTVVAKAVATKVMSSLPSWLFKSNSQTNQEEVQQIPPGEPMTCRFGICDIQRQGFNIWLAPGNSLAVVTDNLSRIVLIDCNRGVALKIWKGYRDAQCAFIESKEQTLKTDTAEKRKALFLAIYAPRRSVLEIWALQHGPKVAAFNVSKNGQLVYNTHELMAIGPKSKVKFALKRCVFIDPSDESLKEVIAPFHCALSNDDSKTSKDVHLFRRIKLLLRGDSTAEEIANVASNCRDFQTNEIRLQCLHYLAGNKKVTSTMFKESILGMRSSMEMESITDSSPLHSLIENYLKLADFYIYMVEDGDDEPNQDVEKLCLTETDILTIQKLLDLTIVHHEGQSNRVAFKEIHCNGDFAEYLGVFVFEKNEIKLNPKKRDVFGFVGQMLYRRFLEKGHRLKTFYDHASDSGISSEDLMAIAIYYWLEKPFIYTRSEEVIEDMTKLASILHTICVLAGQHIDYEYNSICPWWQKVREIILETPCALRGLLATLVCRNVSHLMQRNVISEENEDGIWEKVSQEAAQWSLLSGKLDDVSMLGAILNYPLSSANPEMPIIRYQKPDCSLKSIVLGGKGIISELVGKWLANSGVHPSKIVEKSQSQDMQMNETSEATEEVEGNATIKEENPETVDIVIAHLEQLRAHYPFSLESGILLCQLAWEFMCYWSKNLPSLEYLNAGLECLQTFRPEDYAFKQGVCCMIWNAHLKIPLEATKKLIHKAGRLPKEKLCQQDIGLSVSAIPEFLEQCLAFFKQFSKSLDHAKKELKFEEDLIDGQIPLPHLTLQQNIAIPEIIDLHIQLCKVLHLIAFFSLKIPKPLTLLFDAMSNQTFFMEINRELPYKLPPADLVLKKHRQEFLCKVVSASMDLIREDLERLYVLEHAIYMSQVEELADMWELDKNAIKRHQIVEMYAHGWDGYAEELLEDIVESEDMGRLLLEIAGRRLNSYTLKNRGAYMEVASIGSQLLNYLDNLKADSNGIQISGEPQDDELERLCLLAAKSFQWLAQRGHETKHLRVAGQLYDACCLVRAKVQLGELLD